MSDIETIRAEIKKLSAKAMQAKMDLHDLSEELPINWERSRCSDQTSNSNPNACGSVVANSTIASRCSRLKSRGRPGDRRGGESRGGGNGPRARRG